LRIKDTNLRQKEFILTKIILAGRNAHSNINGGMNLQSQNSYSLKNITNDDNRNMEELNKTKSGGNFSVILNEDFCLESSFKKSWNKSQFNLSDLCINNLQNLENDMKIEGVNISEKSKFKINLKKSKVLTAA
jgi:hypothetical protein